MRGCNEINRQSPVVGNPEVDSEERLIGWLAVDVLLNFLDMNRGQSCSRLELSLSPTHFKSIASPLVESRIDHSVPQTPPEMQGACIVGTKYRSYQPVYRSI
jgi:hypothetical protein